MDEERVERMRIVYEGPPFISSFFSSLISLVFSEEFSEDRILSLEKFESLINSLLSHFFHSESFTINLNITKSSHNVFLLFSLDPEIFLSDSFLSHKLPLSESLEEAYLYIRDHLIRFFTEEKHSYESSLAFQPLKTHFEYKKRLIAFFSSLLLSFSKESIGQVKESSIKNYHLLFFILLSCSFVLLCLLRPYQIYYNPFSVDLLSDTLKSYYGNDSGFYHEKEILQFLNSFSIPLLFNRESYSSSLSSLSKRYLHFVLSPQTSNENNKSLDDWISMFFLTDILSWLSLYSALYILPFISVSFDSITAVPSSVFYSYALFNFDKNPLSSSILQQSQNSFLPIRTYLLSFSEKGNKVKSTLESIDSLFDSDKIVCFETNLDDSRGEFLGSLFSFLLSEGALDVFLVSTLTKKNRPGFLLTVLCKEARAPRLLSLLFQYSGTFGIRYRIYDRYILRREIKTHIVKINGKNYQVRIKIGKDRNSHVINKKIEFEDLLRIAESERISLKEAEWRVLRLLR